MISKAGVDQTSLSTEAGKQDDTAAAAVARLAFAAIKERTGSSSTNEALLRLTSTDTANTRSVSAKPHPNSSASEPMESCGSCEGHPAVRLALAKQGIDLSRRIIAWADRERGLWYYRNVKSGDPLPDSSSDDTSDDAIESSDAFECRFEVRWADLDGNRHVRNTAFSEYATHTRFQLLAAHGFTQASLESLRFGPVMTREEIRYRREVLFGDALRVSVRFCGLSVDSSHWRVGQEVLRCSDDRAASIWDTACRFSRCPFHFHLTSSC